MRIKKHVGGGNLRIKKSVVLLVDSHSPGSMLPRRCLRNATEERPRHISETCLHRFVRTLPGSGAMDVDVVICISEVVLRYTFTTFEHLKG